MGGGRPAQPPQPQQKKRVAPLTKESASPKQHQELAITRPVFIGQNQQKPTSRPLCANESNYQQPTQRPPLRPQRRNKVVTASAWRTTDDTQRRIDAIRSAFPADTCRQQERRSASGPAVGPHPHIGRSVRIVRGRQNNKLAAGNGPLAGC